LKFGAFNFNWEFLLAGVDTIDIGDDTEHAPGSAAEQLFETPALEEEPDIGCVIEGTEPVGHALGAAAARAGLQATILGRAPVQATVIVDIPARLRPVADALPLTRAAFVHAV
jgi:hypothetical protein